MAAGTLIFLEQDSKGWHEAWNGLRMSHYLRWGTADPVAHNAQYSECWQYMGTLRREGSPDEHQFRHRMHPISGKREYINTHGLPNVVATAFAFPVSER